MDYLQEHFPEYDCDEYGNVTKNGEPAKIFKSNKYFQVLLFDKNHKRKVCGVHTVMAMKYLNYFEGCIVHHLDGNTTNNLLSNLEVQSRSQHSHYHAGHKEINTNEWSDEIAGQMGNMIKTRAEQKRKYRKAHPPTSIIACPRCGKAINKNGRMCRECYEELISVTNHITRDELKSAIRTMPFTRIGEMFDVTDNAIRKWCRRYGLPTHSREIKRYTEEEWMLI